MNNYKVLVICEAIFNKIEKERHKEEDSFRCNDETINYRQIGNWFFIGRENYDSYPEMPSCHLKFAKTKEIKVILIHRWTKDKSLKKLREADEGKQFKIYGFHTTQEKIVDKIKKCDYRVIDELKKNELNKFLTLLIHLIAHLWLPLDIDLMGILECWNDEKKKDIAKDYLKEVLESKSANYYRQKLANLWYMVVKGKMDDGRWKIGNKEKKKEDRRLTMECGGKGKIECVPVPPKDPNLLANGNDAIIDLIDDEKKKIEDVKKYWEILLNICGLDYENDAPFNKEKIYPQSLIFKSQDSPILQFMCLMDCKIQKLNNGKTIESADVEEIFGFDWNKLNSELEVTDFHSWFCTLDECLNRLRGKLFSSDE